MKYKSFTLISETEEDFRWSIVVTLNSKERFHSRGRIQIASYAKNRKYNDENRGFINEKAREYRLAHPETIKQRRRSHYLKYKDRILKQRAIYRQSVEYKNTHRISNKKYNQTEKGKIARRKSNAKRKNFGFLPLNEHFNGCEAHHIDIEHIIYIPKEMHRSISHSLKNDKNMKIINEKAFAFLKKR